MARTTLHLPEWAGSRFDLLPDRDLLDRLTDQMTTAGGDLKPAECWMLPEEEASLPLNEYLEPLNGPPGPILLQDTITPETGEEENLGMKRYAKWRLVPYYESYLRGADSFGLLDGIDLQALADRNWRVMDLESLMDFLHLSAACDFSGDDLTILEVGSGFGRLPEFLMKILDRKIRYINVDAVPASMMWFDVYMRHTFPDLKVGTLTEPGAMALEDFDVLTIPAWHLAAIELPGVDIGINIESLQEMNQSLVDFYIGLFDRTVRSGGTIMLINSREHEFIGEWNFPPHWRCRFRHRSPRAWTDDYRTELFEKTGKDCSAENAIREVTYQRELALTRFHRASEEAEDREFNPHALPGA